MNHLYSTSNWRASCREALAAWPVTPSAQMLGSIALVTASFPFRVNLCFTFWTAIFPAENISSPCADSEYSTQSCRLDTTSNFVFDRKSCADSRACSTVLIPVVLPWPAPGMPTTQVTSGEVQIPFRHILNSSKYCTFSGFQGASVYHWVSTVTERSRA